MNKLRVRLGKDGSAGIRPVVRAYNSTLNPHALYITKSAGMGIGLAMSGFKIEARGREIQNSAHQQQGAT